jgi:(p)ppGpp synthase/HD superfamily hydrolase
MLKEALQIAVVAHEGQVDKAGEPYIDHPVRIAGMVEGEDAKVVALLHDVVEDSDVSLDDLAEFFPARIVAAVDAVTRRADETYFEFVARAALDPLGKIVKHADVQDHLGPGHEDAIPVSLIKRYRKALAMLA